MKIFLLLTVLGLSFGSSILNGASNEFLEFITKFNKNYDTVDEFQKRSLIFP